MHLALRNVSMQFGSVVALSGVSLDVRSGEVVCLLGDNGAGKSTVIRILSGVHQPTSGQYQIDGNAVAFDSPRAAMSHGIATVHQDLGLIPMLSIWRNFFLGAERTVGRGPLKRIDIAGSRAIVREALAGMGINVRDADDPVAMLSGGERQSIAIARAIHRGARVLILDEPTAALGVKQAALVLRNIALAKERGAAVLFVTHNPQHALDAGDRLIVLRQGSVLAERTRADTNAVELTALMSGQG